SRSAGLAVLSLLLGCLRLLLAPSPPAARAPARLLRGRQVLCKRVRDLLQRAEVLAGGVDQLVGAGGVALCGGEQGRSYLERLLAGRIDQLRRVLLVPVPAGGGERAEQALGLGELCARPAVLNLAGGPCEPPDPTGENLLGSVGLALADRAQQDANALDAVLVPRRRLGDQSNQVVEVGALNDHRDPVGERGHPQPAVRVLC